MIYAVVLNALRKVLYPLGYLVLPVNHKSAIIYESYFLLIINSAMFYFPRYPVDFSVIIMLSLPFVYGDVSTF